jgi:hypothetical protein
VEEGIVKRLFAIATLAAATGPWALAADVAPAVAISPAPAVSAADAVRDAVRTDKRGLVEKNMQLSAKEAKVFWPLYDDYQRKLDRIVQRQNRAVLDYINAEDSMTDANAKRIAHEVLAADGEEQKLRERSLRKMLAVLPARKAVRFLQIENKIRTLNRYDLAERIALVR